MLPVDGETVRRTRSNPPPRRAGAAAGDAATRPRRGRPRSIERFLAPGRRPWVIAHRGFSARAPENTVAAVAAAITAGADMVEVDVAATADHRAVCLHDATVDRTTDGSGPVRDLLFDELARLDAGSWFHAAFRGERVPALGEVLAAARGRVLVNVEIKPEALEVVGAVVAGVVEHGMTDQVVVSSFAPDALRRITALDPAIATISLLDDDLHRGLDPAAVITAVGSRGINLSLGQLSSGLVRRCAALGIPLGVYTVNHRRTVRRLARLGVNAIFTDRPDRVIDELALGHR